MVPPSESLSPEQVRLFIAVAIPEAVRAELERAQIELRRALPEVPVRWTRPEQFHLTLKFLGNVASGQIESLTHALRGVCREFGPLRLLAQQVGSFPNWRKPRVIWAGVYDRQQALLRLQSALESASQSFSAEEREQRFAGHVTLGRIKDIRGAQTDTLSKLGAGMAKRWFGEWWANEVELMRSELGPNGARHTALAKLPLEAPSS